LLVYCLAFIVAGIEQYHETIDVKNIQPEVNDSVLTEYTESEFGEIPFGVEIVHIGNHDYLITYDGHDRASGICHYEDCEYCKQHKTF